MSYSNYVINISPDKKIIVVYSSSAQDHIVDVFSVDMLSRYPNSSKKVVAHAKHCYPEATVHPELKAWVKAQQK
ncbi:hypothetical protein Kuja_0360 [Vibrio phage vB_VchM_Kuja]|uniref:Uncharacterized protein n=1 Tax=Vibrio phage vB_VchM_Kuja TaxID=2686437 RepID=A0A6B9JHP1_9CAUD|nr:hypothetical protein HWC83_gp036 [Vibrio phage vB_VchM_Kuja]QGZ16027.1 hypothetical protein Kuja_0360 [Vibrio phage vB_VchM_Kuja]